MSIIAAQEFETDGKHFYKVAELHELKGGDRKKVKIEPNHKIALFRNPNTLQYHALDANCYHMGGPLVQGDIEVLHCCFYNFLKIITYFEKDLYFAKNKKTTCVVCPWHKYRIDLFTGEGYYEDIHHKMKSKGVKQRVHTVKIIEQETEELESGIYIALSNYDQKVESDHYLDFDEHGQRIQRETVSIHELKQRQQQQHKEEEQQ